MMICLIRVRTHEGERAHLIDRTAFSVGRSPDTDLPVLEAGVSRLHLSVEIRDDGLWITDQNSSNGTYVNEVRIPPREPRRVASDDRVRLGKIPQDFMFMAIPRPFELMDVDLKKESLLASMEEVAKGLEAKAQAKAKEIVEQELRLARLEAERIVSTAQKEAEVFRTQSALKTQEEKRLLEREIARLRQEKQVVSAEESLSARKEADRLISDAQKQIQKDFDEAHRKVEERLRETNAECLELLAKAQEKAKAIQASAQSEAHQLRKQALEETRQQQQDMIRRHEETLQENHQALQRELELKREEVESLKEEHLALRNELRGLDEELQAARELLMAVTDLESRRQRAEHDLERYEKQRAQGLLEIDQEFHKLKETRTVEFEHFKRRQDQELAEAKAKAFESMNKELEKRETDYQETLRLRGIELKQILQERLIIRASRWATDSGQVVTELKQAVDEAVDEIFNSARSSGLGPTSTGNVDLKRRNVRVSRAAVAVGLALAVFGGVYKTQIVGFFAGRSDKSYAAQVMQERREQAAFKPRQSQEFRSSYVDNVLYMEGYFETKTDPLYVEKWTLRLNDLDFLKSMKVSEETIVQFIAKEVNLVQRLGALRDSIDAVYLNEGLARMRKAEAEDLSAMKRLLGGDGNYQKIRRLEEDFLLEFQGSLRRPTSDRSGPQDK